MRTLKICLQIDILELIDQEVLFMTLSDKILGGIEKLELILVTDKTLSIVYENFEWVSDSPELLEFLTELQDIVVDSIIKSATRVPGKNLERGPVFNIVVKAPVEKPHKDPVEGKN